MTLKERAESLLSAIKAWHPLSPIDICLIVCEIEGHKMDKPMLLDLADIEGGNLTVEIFCDRCGGQGLLTLSHELRWESAGEIVDRNRTEESPAPE